MTGGKRCSTTVAELILNYECILFNFYIAMHPQHRQLAAILFTDIVGYTAMMQHDECHAVKIVNRSIAVLKEETTAHFGKILNDYGDGSLCSFSSVTQAVLCSLAIQQQLQTDPSVLLRIGLHVGELFFEGDKVMGDGVNVASRIQSLGQANTILFSKDIFDKIRNQPEFKPVSLGLFEFKNVHDPIEVFALANPGLIVPKKELMTGKLKESKKNSGSLKWIVLSVLIASIAAFFIYKKTHQPGFTGEDKSIAVLSLESVSSSKENEYNSIPPSYLELEHAVTADVNSVPDNYTMRAGANFVFDKLVVTTALRYEGAPAHDLFGQNDGLRRVGHIFSAEPGLQYKLKKSLLYAFVTIPVERRTIKTVQDERAENITGQPSITPGHFANLLVFVGYSFTF